jgi:hypothetical protein
VNNTTTTTGAPRKAVRVAPSAAARIDQEIRQYQPQSSAARLPLVAWPPARPGGMAHTEGACAAGTGRWVRYTQQWDDVPSTADGGVAIFTSYGAVAPSGLVLAGPMPHGPALGAFIAWRWKMMPSHPPQVWLSAHALRGIGCRLDDVNLGDIGQRVADTFGCTVIPGQPGWFTCGFTGPDGLSRSVHLVLMPLLLLRLQETGLAGKPTVFAADSSEPPASEIAETRALAARIAAPRR